MAVANDRAFLIEALARFVQEARQVAGVRRIAVVGSLTTPKLDPKDADVLVTVGEDVDLEALAKFGRKLKGTAQTHNHGADIFLANAEGHYIGRTCSFRECHPRVRCSGTNCRHGGWVCDDFYVLRLNDELIAKPPLEVWPQVVIRGDLPPDLREALLSQDGQHAR
jgi:predicted nucleotidyltransferase